MTKETEGNMHTVQITTGCLIFISLPHILSVPKYLQVYMLVCVYIQEPWIQLEAGVKNSGRVHNASHPARRKRAQPRLTADLQWVITQLWTTPRFLGSCKWQKHALGSLALSFLPQTGIRDFRKNLEYDSWQTLVEECQMLKGKDPLRSRSSSCLKTDWQCAVQEVGII